MADLVSISELAVMFGSDTGTVFHGLTQMRPVPEGFDRIGKAWYVSRRELPRIRKHLALRELAAAS